MTTAKAELYERYVSTHVVPRKGAATAESIRSLHVRWDRLFGRFLPADREARVLDIGCGYGAVVHWLRARGYANAAGIDISAEQIDHGRRLGVAGLELGDARERLRSSPGAFELLVARDLFEHFRKDELLEFLELCHAALRPGGTLVMQVPNGESPLAGRIIYGDFTHEAAFTASSIGQVLRVVGFSRVDAWPVRPIARGIGSAARLALWYAFEAVIKLAIVAEVGRVRTIVTQNIVVAARR